MDGERCRTGFRGPVYPEGRETLSRYTWHYSPALTNRFSSKPMASLSAERRALNVLHGGMMLSLPLTSPVLQTKVCDK